MPRFHTHANTTHWHHRPHCAPYPRIPFGHTSGWGWHNRRPHISHWTGFNPFSWCRPRPVILAPAPTPFFTYHRVAPVSTAAVTIITGIAAMVLGMHLPPPAGIPFFLLGAGVSFIGGAMLAANAS